MKIVKICDGVRLHFLGSDIFEKISFAAIFRCPLEKETVSENLLTAAVLARGNKTHRNRKNIERYLMELGGGRLESYAMKKGNEQDITVYGETINENDNAEKLFELVLETALAPNSEDGGFCSKIFENEKRKALNVLKDKANDKREYAKEKCREAMYAEICADGYEEDIKNTDRKKTFESYRNIVINSAVEIVAAGEVDEKTQYHIEETCKRYFDFERKFEGEPNMNKNSGKGGEIVLDMNTSQSRLCIGYETGIKPNDGRIYSLAVGCEILGGGGNSKLFANVRENKGLCYYISSSLLRFEGDIMTESGINNEDYEETVKSIDEETEKMKNGEFTDEELLNAISALKKRYILLNDSQNAQMDFYINALITGSESDRDKVVDLIGKTTRESVRDSMKGLNKNTTVFLRSNAASR